MVEGREVGRHKDGGRVEGREEGREGGEREGGWWKEGK